MEHQAQPAQHPPSSIHLKPTDITISQSLESVFPEKVGLYNQLKAKERELDLMINKKLLDIQDYQQAVASGLTDDIKDSDILRIFIYNTSENQPWQVTENVEPQQAPQPSWTLRIEGRLLNDSELVGSPSRKKFSSFLSDISVELKSKDGKDQELIISPVNGGTDSRIIEWHDNPQAPEVERQRQQFDGLDIKRGGISIPQFELPEGEIVSTNEKEVVANIVIQPKMFPSKLQIMKESLIELVGCNEITQSDCIHKIFSYIQMNNLFEVKSFQNETQNGNSNPQSQQQIVAIKADDLLYRIFDANSLTFPQIMEILSTKLLKPIEPIRLQYSINTLRNTTLGDIIIDLKVNTKLVDPKVKPGANELESITQLLTESIMNKKSLSDLSKLNENLALNLQLLNYSKLKYDFYKKLSENPVDFLNSVQDKNDEYLKILSSDSMSFGAGGLIDEEIVRRSDFYTDNFLSQHINLLLNSGRL